MHIVAFLSLVLLIGVVCISVNQQQEQPSTETYSNTIADITESRVKNDIKQIRLYQQIFRFHKNCQAGTADVNQSTTSKKCTRPVADAYWQSSSKHVKECFSELIPLLETTRCNMSERQQ